MTDDASTTESRRSAIASPPFNPDPELVWHLEGNRREIRRARAFIVKLKAEVDAEPAAQADREH